jgi:ATP/maltotriose-dependent transcriptional regulator MalT
MPIDPTRITVAELVRHATAIVDPNGADDAVTEFATRYEDDDAPVRGVLEGLEERVAWGADEDPAVVMAQAVTLYLAHRLDEVEDAADEILLLAARSEFDGKPPESVEAWLESRGIEP